MDLVRQQLTLLTVAGVELVCIVNWPSLLKQGQVITLKEYPDTKWGISAVHLLPQDATINRHWRVGGL